jgi:tetratricopeptide (TPR) repeat protein
MNNYKFDASEQEIDDLYYDAMELLDGGSKTDAEKAKKLLMKALILDNKNVQTYVGLANVYGVLNDKRLARQNIKWAYEETIKKFKEWPKQMEWGVIENRRFLRAIQYRADLYADEGNNAKAIEIYRQILAMNSNDNQGIRYVLAGLYAGISGDEINEMFDRCNAHQNWNELEILVKKQNKIHRFWQEIDY